MSPTKDEGSSRCKGKEVTANDPPAKTMGEETSLSESDYSEEEKGGRFGSHLGKVGRVGPSTKEGRGGEAYQ